jgi:hypothetical protein
MIDINNLTLEELQNLKDAFKASEYVRQVWKTNEAYTMNLATYAALINPLYKHVEKASIIEKTTKNDKKFLKMLLTTSNGSSIERELSYNHSFENGDIIDVETLQFGVEECFEKSHTFVTGEIL